MQPLNLPSTFPVTCHTDYVGTGSTFVVIKGFKTDGMQYVAQAVAKGATTIIVEHNAEIPQEISPLIFQKNLPVERVNNTRIALAQLSAQAAGFPARDLRIIGITGTKGKTTTSFLLEHIFRSAGYKTALISTVNNSICGQKMAAPLTTPQPDYLHQFLRLCANTQVEWVIMEVAAQALTMHRIEGIEFDGVIFTNFSQEHAEFYSTNDDYFQAKCHIFNHIKPDSLILFNGDDAKIKEIISCQKQAIPFGLNNQFPVHVAGSHDRIILKTVIETIRVNKQSISIDCPALMGQFNLYNLMAAVGMASNCGIDPAIISQSITLFPGVPGRLQQHRLSNGALGVIDYAHNPSSYGAVLSTLRSLTPHLIVVFGAGGCRDASKRPIMGELATSYADLVVITSDNPRTEDPQKIINDILSGISLEQKKDKVLVEPDREKAIRLAYSKASSESMLVLLGKGPDEYQIIGDQKIKFSEQEILQSL